MAADPEARSNPGVPAPEAGGRDRLSPGQWAAVLAAPSAWLAFTAIAWALPPAICEGGGRGWLHAWAAASVAAGVVGIVLGARAARAGTTGGFVAGVGTMVSVVALFALLLAWAFLVAFGPCD